MNNYTVNFELNGELKSELSEGVTGESAWQKILIKYLKDESCRKISLISTNLRLIISNNDGNEADNVE